MPIYEFRCRHCGASCERVLSMAELQEVQFCMGCDEQLDLVPSVPARVTPGTYGKAGGREPRIDR